MSGRWVAIALLVSLGVNLALGGYLVGRQMHRPGPVFDPVRAFPIWARTLPEPRREALRPLLDEVRPQRRIGWRTLREQQVRMREAVRAEPFSAEALAASLAALRQTHADAQAAGHAAFVRFVTALEPRERARLAEDLAHPRRRDRGMMRGPERNEPSP